MIAAWGDDHSESLQTQRGDLKEILNVSAVRVTDVTGSNMSEAAIKNSAVSVKNWEPGVGGYGVMALPASGHKCARCWNFMPEVSNYGIWQNVCTRCHNALHEMGIPNRRRRPLSDLRSAHTLSTVARSLSPVPCSLFPVLGGRPVSFPAPRKLPWLLLISVVVIVADRITKTLVASRVPLGGGIPVIPGFLRITHWLNEGAAFSLFADSASPNAVRWGLIAFSAIAAIAVLIALIRLGSRITLATVALALVLGGALGNLHDRIVYGSVVDFIEVHIFSYHWPDFNVADSSIVIGACLLLLDSLLPRKSPEPSTTIESR